MAIKLGSNIESLRAQRRLGEASSSLEKIYERLSSGQRINRASDDAAGMAIAEDLKVKGRIFTQAIRNGNDGISLLNIADSAVDSLTGIVTRIRELAEQSANGTYTSKQRDALDKEAQALKSEFFRISNSTSFNGIKLFDGSLGSGVSLQLGMGAESAINSSIGGAIGTGSLGTATSYAAENYVSFDSALGDLNGDGILDLVTVGGDGGTSGYATIRLGNASGSFGTALSMIAESYVSMAVSLGDLNGDGILDLVTGGQGGGVGVATVRLGRGNGTFGSATSFTTGGTGVDDIALGDLNGDGKLDLVTVDSAPGGIVTVRLGTGTGSLGASTTYTAETNGSYAVSLGDLNGDGILDLVTSGYAASGVRGRTTVRLGTGSGTFGSATSYTAEARYSFAVQLGDLNGDGILDMVSGGYDNSFAGRITVRLGAGNGSFASATSYLMDASVVSDIRLADLNGDGFLDVITAGTGVGTASNTIRLGQGNGTFGSSISYSTESLYSYSVSVGDINRDGVVDVVTSGDSGASGGFATVRFSQTKDGISPLLNFSLKTAADSLQAFGILDNSLNNLAKQRSVIGANQSRVSVAINNLSSTKENFAAAESRIRDTDIAADAAELIRTQILQQAATSVLAQANQSPQIALKLLQQ